MEHRESVVQPKLVERDAQLVERQLQASFGKHKKFLPEFKQSALTALSFFPELANIKIEFAWSKSSQPFTAHVKYATLFRRAEKRTYVVCISRKMKKGREGVAPENLSFNQLTGCIAHELAHISDYVSKNSLKVLGTTLKYPFRKFRRKYEHKIDRATVRHGLGNQLKDFARLVSDLGKRHPKDSYFRQYFDFYLRPEEIDEMIMVRERVKAQNPFDDAGRKERR